MSDDADGDPLGAFAAYGFANAAEFAEALDGMSLSDDPEDEASPPASAEAPSVGNSASMGSPAGGSSDPSSSSAPTTDTTTSSQEASGAATTPSVSPGGTPSSHPSSADVSRPSGNRSHEPRDGSHEPSTGSFQPFPQGRGPRPAAAYRRASRHTPAQRGFSPERDHGLETGQDNPQPDLFANQSANQSGALAPNIARALNQAFSGVQPVVQQPYFNPAARVQRDQTSKDAVTAPRSGLAKSELLKNPDDFLATVRHFLMLGQQLLNKVWCSTIEAWCRQQLEPNSQAYFEFDTAIQSGIRVCDPQKNTYFSDFRDYKLFLLATFRGVGTTVLSQIEAALPRLHVSQLDRPHTARNCVALANLIREVFSYAPEGKEYSLGQQIERIRVRLPLRANQLLKEQELHAKSTIEDYPTLIRHLQMVDTAFTNSSTQGKKRAPEAHLRAIDSRAGPRQRANDGNRRPASRTSNNRNRIDNRAACTHCHKRGHAIDSCWILHPNKKAEFETRRQERRNGVFSQQQLQAINAQVAAAVAKTSMPPPPPKPINQA